MGSRGASGTSMRAVASACGLNVATLYHYFPSKRDLLQAAIAPRRGAAPPPRPVPPRKPLGRAVAAGASHGDADVPQPLVETADAFEQALAGWLRDLCPDAPALHQPPVVRALRKTVIGVLVEHLPQPDGTRAALRARAIELRNV